MTATRALASATAAFLLVVAVALPAQQPVGDAARAAAAGRGLGDPVVDAGRAPAGTSSPPTASRPRAGTPPRVPSTVLAALVRNGVYPDPRVGLNDLRIPDASDEFNRKHDLAKFSHLPDGRNPWKDPYWYRTEFTLPDSARARRVWLNFEAINYRADVWLNGRRIADRAGMVGALRRFEFDVTGAVAPGKNCLAVMVYPWTIPACPTRSSTCSATSATSTRTS